VQRARGSLKQALFALRRDLDCEQLTVGRAVLRLNPSVISADVVEFVHAHNKHDHLAAVTLYRGEFLSGIRIRGSPEFDEWAEKQRSIFSAYFRKDLEELATNASSREEALRWWKQLAEADPFAASTAVSYMRALAALGRREDAICFGLAHIQRVRTDLDATPEPEVIELLSKLRTCSVGAGAPAPESRPASQVPSAVHRPTIVARMSRTLWAAAVPLTLAGAMIPFTGDAPSPSRRPPGQGIRVEKFTIFPKNDTLLDRFTDVGATLESELKVNGFTAVSDPLDENATGQTEPIGRATTILGSISHEGDSIVFRAAVRDGRTGSIVNAIEPIRVTRGDISRARTVLSREVFAALGRPLESREYPLLTLPRFHADDSVLKRMSFPLRSAASRMAGPVTPPWVFPQAYYEDSLFTAAMLGEAFLYRARDSLWAATPLLSRLNHQRVHLSHLNRIALSYLIYEANGDFDSKLKIARKGSDLAPQSAWSLEAARLSIDAGQNVDAETYLERFEKGLTWMTPPLQRADFDFLSVETAHRANDPAAEWRAIDRALAAGDTTIHVQYALARRLILDRKYLEGSRVVLQMFHSHRSESYDLTTRLQSEVRCHLSNKANISWPVYLLFRDSLPRTAGRARTEAYEAMDRGTWWYASHRFRAVLDSFPQRATLQDSARAAWVEANMIDTQFADKLISALDRTSYLGDGSAEYWLAAALVRRGRIKEAEPLLEVARRKGLPVLRSGHSSAPDLALLRLNHLVRNVPECLKDQ
jgi:DNA-binding SARP family transcriptional activator